MLFSSFYSPFRLPAFSWSLAALLCVSAAGHVSAQTKEWEFHKTADGQHPNGMEQQMMWLLNRARDNPAAEGAYLMGAGDSYVVQMLAYFGVDMNLMRREFEAIPPAPPAAFDSRLYEASRRQSEYMIRIGAQSHEGQEDRVVECNFDCRTARLSVFSACDTAQQAHVALNIDYGDAGFGMDSGMQTGRGHRAAIMSNFGPGMEPLSNVGLALVEERNPLTLNVGPYVFSATYAAANDIWEGHYNRFVVGTVWRDKNGNRQYDPGEGLKNVRVEMEKRTWYAVTGEAGGYAFPVITPGSAVLTFSGGPLAAPMFRKITVGSVSALSDLEITTPPPDPVPFATTVRREADGTLTLKWVGGKGPYQVQQTNHLDGGWKNMGAPTMALTANVRPEGSNCYFRVACAE